MSGLRHVNFQFIRFDLWKSPRRPWLPHAVTVWFMPRRSASKKTGRSTVRAAREKVILGLRNGLGSVPSMFVPNFIPSSSSLSRTTRNILIQGCSRVQWPMMFKNITSNHCFWQLRICDRSCECKISMAGRHSTFEVTRHLSGKCYGRAKEAFKRSFGLLLSGLDWDAEFRMYKTLQDNRVK